MVDWMVFMECVSPKVLGLYRISVERGWVYLLIFCTWIWMFWIVVAKGCCATSDTYLGENFVSDANINCWMGRPFVCDRCSIFLDAAK